MRYLTGVGSRDITQEEGERLKLIAYTLGRKGYLLRSGGAKGSDTCFEEVYSDKGFRKEIYLPWNGFNGLYKGDDNFILNDYRAEEIASGIHPYWSNLSQGAKKLHSRNTYQVLGGGLDAPSNVLVCCSDYDKDGIVKGGTRTAWLLAKSYSIPCFNIRDGEQLELLLSILKVSM